MSSVTITIDGIKIPAEEGMTVLQAAQANGLYIPNLCNHPDLDPEFENEIQQFKTNLETILIDKNLFETVGQVKLSPKELLLKKDEVQQTNMKYRKLKPNVPKGWPRKSAKNSNK